MQWQYRVQALVSVLMVIAPSAFAAPWISEREYDSVCVVARNAQGADAKAVREFVTYWERSTGSRPAVREQPEAGVNVWIGTAALPTEWRTILDLGALGFDGVVVRTFPADKGKNLVLAGAPEKGTLFAVYEFLEQALGVRWLTPGVVSVPAPPERISAMDYRYAPPFMHRLTGLAKGADPDQYRMNSPFQYGLNGHTLYDLVPPEKHFSDHPEYYAEVDGKRVAPVGFDWRDLTVALAHVREVGQLCMSNPEVAEVLARELKARMAANPKANLWAVAQMDWGNNCACPRCKEIDEREGSPAGSFLTGVNRVAELIAQDYPDAAIQTYAYTHTRKPPKTIRPRPNVIVQFCSFGCDFAHTFDDPEATANRSFVEDLKGWNALGARLFLYDYPINCRYRTRPYPNEYVMAKDLAFMAENGAIGAYEQGSAGESVAFGPLKGYVISKLLWNPKNDAGALAREFIERYYGKAAPYVWRYWQLCHETLRRSGAQMFLFDDCGWIDRRMADKAEKLFKQAFVAAESGEIRRRVDLDYFHVQCAAQLCRPAYSFKQDRIIINRPKMPTRDEMTKRAEELGVASDYPSDWPPLNDVLAGFPVTPSAGVTTSPLVALENERYLTWVAPEMKGSILRIRDKKHRVDILKGYVTYGTAPGTYQEWSAIGEMGEGAVAPAYQVRARDTHEATLTATTKSGLRIDRTMRLAAGSDRVELHLDITNDASSPQAVSVKMHPEFYCQRPKVLPELWAKGAEGWRRVKEDDTTGTSVGVKVMNPEPSGAWGVYIPQADISLLNDCQPEQIDKLIYYYNTGKGAEQINLELLPKRTVLQPGERHGVDTSYTVVRGRPGDRR